MSLLLDALKRAEQAKQAKQDDSAAEPSPAPSAATAAGLSLALEDAAPQKPAASSPSTAPVGDREAVRNVFASKQSAPVRTRKQPAWMLPVAAVVLFAIGGGGWYVWKEVSKISRPSVAAAPVPPKAVSSIQPPVVATPPAPVDAKPPVDGLSPPSPKLTEVPLPEKVAGSKTAQAPAEKAREDLARSLKANEGKRDSPLALKLAKGLEPPKVSEDLAAAYSTLRAGNLADARKRYSALVSAEGTNLDARLGLATVLARSGETAAAAREYKKALEIDPQNSTALTALLVLADVRSLPALEADLRAMLNKYPESPALYFALGNSLSAQSRWTEAQQSYFDAWRLDTDNADYAFNLAISLDQLRQARLAQDYYAKALALAQKHGAQFDRRQAERRLNELKASSAP